MTRAPQNENLGETEFCDRNTTCNLMMTSFAAYCTRELDLDMLMAFPGLGECAEKPSELLSVRTGLAFEEQLPFPVKGAFLPEAKDASRGNCNAGSLGCACITLSSDRTKGVVAMSDGTGNCALGLVCKRLVCQRANVTAESAAAATLATSGSLLLLAWLVAAHTTA